MPSFLHHSSVTICQQKVAEPQEYEDGISQGKGTAVATPNDTGIPLPSHRHATPSAPWPWIDIDDEVDKEQLEKDRNPVPVTCQYGKDSWKGYPQSLYPNWTPRQVQKSGIRAAISKEQKCVIYQVDVTKEGHFQLPGIEEIRADPNNLEEARRSIYNLQIDPTNRVRVLFIENLSGPVLQMLGTKNNIEPFFFSSSLKWIPSRYQESLEPGEGDHITICLTFLRSISPQEGMEGITLPPRSTVTSRSSTLFSEKSGAHDRPNIDTQGPLYLQSTATKRTLIPNLLSIHLIRKKTESIIISYHPDDKGDGRTTSAGYLHERIRFAGQSVYWQNIFQKYEDPTFVLLLFIWHTLYAWDEALEHLYAHICKIEGETIATRELGLTEELHSIRAHLYHYSSLLNDVRKSVNFLKSTKTGIRYEQNGDEVMDRECDNLLAEIDRLESGRQMQDQRLKNVMNLVFSSVNILDSKAMHELTKLTARDSAAMKQIAYLSMFFLPASFIASIFGMNVREITPGTNGTLVHYVVAALPFTLTTIWIIIAFQSKYIFGESCSFWKRLGWPYLFVTYAYDVKYRKGKRSRRERDFQQEYDMA